MEHTLSLKNDGTASCSCGEPINYTNKKDIIELWENHVQVPALLEELKEAAAVEQQARLNVENTVRRLAQLGVSTTIIAAKTEVNGGPPVISKTVAQRLAKEPIGSPPRRRYAKKAASSKGEHVQTPRRGRASSQQE